MLKRIFLLTIFGVSMSSLASGAESLDDQFLARSVTYEMMGDRVVLIGREAPTMTTVDDWGQLVFLAADGEHTVSELIVHLGKQYAGGIPKELPEQVRHIVREMVKSGFLALRPARTPLPYYLSMPMSLQDKQRTKQLMESDGFMRRAAK
jgi:hypothetical protein